MDGSFYFLFPEAEPKQPDKATVTPIKCGNYTQKEYEEAMEWLLFGDDKNESST